MLEPKTLSRHFAIDMGAISGKAFRPCCGSRENHQEYDEKPINSQPALAQQKWAMSVLANPIVLGQVCKKSFRQYQQNGLIDGQELKLVSTGVCEQLKIGHNEKLQFMTLSEMSKDANSTFTLEEFQRFFELYLKHFCNSPSQDSEAASNNGLMSVYSKRYDSAEPQ